MNVDPANWFVLFLVLLFVGFVIYARINSMREESKELKEKEKKQLF